MFSIIFYDLTQWPPLWLHLTHIQGTFEHKPAREWINFIDIFLLSENFYYKYVTFLFTYTVLGDQRQGWAALGMDNAGSLDILLFLGLVEMVGSCQKQGLHSCIHLSYMYTILTCRNIANLYWGKKTAAKKELKMNREHN